MCRKLKTTIFFLRPASWGIDISLFYHSDINLFLIDYTCCKLCNIWLLLFENNSRSYRYTKALHRRENLVAVITQDRVRDNNLKRQIKNRTFYTFRLFLLTQFFQHISNWPKVFEHLPILFLQYSQRNNFSKFFYINNFEVGAVLYINWAKTSLFIISCTLSTLKLPMKIHALSKQLFFF